VVLGSPNGDLSVIVNAIEAITRLAVCSLAEDPYGKVQSDIPTIIRTFTTTVTNLEHFLETLEVHWSDEDHVPGTEVPEVETLLRVLRDGLQELVAAFGDYDEALRLSKKDMRLARQAAIDKRKKAVVSK